MNRLYQVPEGKTVGKLCVCCYKRNYNSGTSVRTWSSNAIYFYITSPLAEKLQNYSPYCKMYSLTANVSETQQMELYMQKMKALVFYKGLSRK